MSETTSESGRGRLVVISGPSGVGKTTVCQALLDRLPDAMLSVSATTRPQRDGERDGEDYRFVSEAEFETLVREGRLLEHAVYQGNRYGTPAGPVESAIGAGRQVVLEIDVQGGVQIAERMPESMRVFIMPPDDETLRSRLVGRGTEAPEIREKRLAAARREIGMAQKSGVYPHLVTNVNVDETVDSIISLMSQESTRA